MLTSQRVACVFMILFAAWVLVGCSTIQSPPTIVAVAPTVQLPEKPVYAVDTVNMLTATDEEVAKAYLITVEQCRAYSATLENLLSGVTNR